MDKLRISYLKYKVLILRFVARAMLGKANGYAPATVIDSIEASLHNPDLRKHVLELMAVSEPLIEKYDFPGNYPSGFRRHKAFDKKNLYMLTDVCVAPNSGLTWAENRYFLAESVGSVFRQIGWGGLQFELLLKRKRLREKRFMVACPAPSYFRWLFESLPAVLIALEAKPFARVLLATDSPAYCKDMLKLMFGAQLYRKHVLEVNGVKRVPYLLTLQHEPDAAFIHPVAIRYLHQLRDKLLDGAAIGSGAANIYVSQRKVSTKGLVNEKEVEDKLRAIGFIVVHCDDLTIAQQIAIFSQATCVIASHCEGLSNLIWARNRVNVLEIFTHNHFNDCFARLSVKLGFNYTYLVAGKYKQSGSRVKIEVLLDTARRIKSIEPEQTVCAL